MRICRNCNQFMEDEMIFCPECGVKYISFDEQIYESENCPVVLVEQSIFLNDGKVQTVLVFGNVGEKTITSCAVRLKCKDPFGTELPDTVVKFIDLSAEPQTMFGDDKLIAPVDEETREIHVVVDMLVFEDGTKWNGSAGEWKLSNAHKAFNTSKNDAIQQAVQLEYWKEFLSIERNSDSQWKQKELKDNPGIALPYGITEIPGHAFEGCKNLSSITIPDSVTSIGEFAFRECTNLTSVTIPDSVTSIGNYAFSFCESLTSITIPDSVTSIGESAFYACKSLTSITIPHSVTSIEEDTFTACTSLVSITIPKSVTCIKRGTFSNCFSLTNVTIPYGVTSIGKCAFEGCKSLTSITIPSSVTYLDSMAFYNTSCKIIRSKGDGSSSNSGGCYVATCVYGSYDCPQVWTLRRYRDNTLAETWHGRAFIRAYYAISPTIVKLFGHTKWFRKMWKGKLDKMVSRLQKSGYESTPYEDRKW